VVSITFGGSGNIKVMELFTLSAQIVGLSTPVVKANIREVSQWNQPLKDCTPIVRYAVPGKRGTKKRWK
jgi:hypothetical protein